MYPEVITPPFYILLPFRRYQDSNLESEKSPGDGEPTLELFMERQNKTKQKREDRNPPRPTDFTRPESIKGKGPTNQ